MIERKRKGDTHVRARAHRSGVCSARVFDARVIRHTYAVCVGTRVLCVCESESESDFERERHACVCARAARVVDTYTRYPLIRCCLHKRPERRGPSMFSKNVFSKYAFLKNKSRRTSGTYAGSALRWYTHPRKRNREPVMRYDIIISEITM